MPDFHTIQFTLDSNEAAEYARRLIDGSAWFALMPLPFDKWEISVKPERASMFNTSKQVS